MKKALQDALDARGYDVLTPVQQAVLAPELSGRDLLVSAQTGSGKTLGFGLAIAPSVLGEAETLSRADAPLALVIAPTRELALQVKRELAWLYEKAGAVMASCVGGMDMRDERRALARGAHIVAATPGRLRDHILRGSIDLSALRAVVLDEADEMLDLGFREDLEFILNEAPEARQTLLFSATVPKPIAALAEQYQKNAERIMAASSGPQHADITYRAMMVADRDTDAAIINTLRYYEAPNAIVFANTRAAVSRLTTRLSNRGFQVVALSGELSQAERSHALQAMRDGRAQVCVATDVAARGIDLPNLDLVIHSDLPGSPDTLLHRSGRTGRAGRKGVSALIVTNKIRTKANRVLGWAKVKAEWGGAPSADDVRAKDADRMLTDPVWDTPPSESETARIAALLEGRSPEALSTAVLRLWEAGRSAPEELSDMDAPKAQRDFGASVWFSLSWGRDAGAEPRRILPMLCDQGGLDKDDIGAIRARDTETYVQIAQAKADALAAALGAGMALEPGRVLTRLDSPPELGRPAHKSGPKPHRGKAPHKPAQKTPYQPKAREARADTPKSRGQSPRPLDRAPTPPAQTPSKPAPKPKPKSKPNATDRGGEAAPQRQHKGPKPPAGKPSSKKNRARAAAKAAVKSTAKGQAKRKG